jgi:hypothetical protein
MPGEPVCTAIMFCDLVVTEATTGKNTLVGTFGQFNAPQFPFFTPRFIVFVSITNMEVKDSIAITVNIRAPRTGAVLGSVSANLNRDPVQPIPAGTVPSVDLPLPFQNVPFHDAGRYEVAVLVDGSEIGHRDVFVNRLNIHPLG